MPKRATQTPDPRSETERENTAYHEAGHAVLHVLLAIPFDSVEVFGLQGPEWDDWDRPIRSAARTLLGVPAVWAAVDAVASLLLVKHCLTASETRRVVHATVRAWQAPSRVRRLFHSLRQKSV